MIKTMKFIENVLIIFLFLMGVAQKEFSYCYISLLIEQCMILNNILNRLNRKEEK